MAVGPVGANPQMQVQQAQQPQIRQLENVTFQDDAQVSYATFDNVSASRPAETDQTRTGFGIDLNRDGVFNKETDAYLAFDMDGDGKYTSADVQKTNDYLKVLGGNEDLDGDGNVSFRERSDARAMMQQFGSADLDQDGTLSGWEMAELGGMVVQLGTDGEGNPTSNIVNLPGFEADRMPPQPNPMDPSSWAPQPNPEFDAWRGQMWSQWSNVLGMDLVGFFNNPTNQPGAGRPMQFPPITAGMFGGGGGMFGGGGSMFPQFNFSSFNPMAGQSFDNNGFPSFFSTGVPFL